MRIQNINYQATAKIPKITHYKNKLLKMNLTKDEFVKLNKNAKNNNKNIFLNVKYFLTKQFLNVKYN